MTIQELLSLGGAAALVGTVCLLVHRIDTMLRSAARSVTAIAEETWSMRRHVRAVSPGIEAMNQNLYVVAVQLAQLGEAAERRSEPPVA